MSGLRASVADGLLGILVEEVRLLHIHRDLDEFLRGILDRGGHPDDDLEVADVDVEVGLGAQQLAEVHLRGQAILLVELVEGEEVLGTNAHDDLLADARYELIYGHRRVSACKVLGFTTIPAFIVDTTVNSAEVTMTENFMPVSVTQIDEYSVVYVMIIPISVNCTSTLVEEFEKINDDTIEIPEAEFFKSKLDG